MTSVIAVIPARMGSSRFPGKPLAMLLGKPMIQHVFERTLACPDVDEVVIATCDEVIRSAATAFGAQVVMTSVSHVRATARVAEAVAQGGHEVVVMVQGDEPLVRPEMISAAVRAMLEETDLGCVNLVAPIPNEQELLSRNTIKVAVARNGNILYLSRSVIPSTTSNGSHYKQVCICPFRARTLADFSSLPVGRLEMAESIDMLRFLENGVRIRAVTTEFQTQAVDVPDDLLRVAQIMRQSGAIATAPPTTVE